MEQKYTEKCIFVEVDSLANTLKALLQLSINELRIKRESGSYAIHFYIKN